MKLQFKLLIIVVPFVLLSLLAIGLWSFNEAKLSVYESNYRYLRIVLETYTTESLHQNYHLLKDAKMDKVVSYVENYQKDAMFKAASLSLAMGRKRYFLQNKKIKKELNRAHKIIIPKVINRILLTDA